MSRARAVVVVLGTVVSLGVSGCGAASSPVESRTASATTPTPSRSASQTSTPAASTASDQPTVALSDDAGLGSRAYWTVRPEDGWLPTIVEQNGRNQIKNESTGCQLTTVQTEAVPEKGTDELLSHRVLVAQAGGLAQKAGTKAVGQGRLVVLGGAVVPRSEPSVEMDSARVDYTRQDTGQAYTTYVVVREFGSTHTLMLAVLACPSRLLPTKAAATKVLDARASITTQ